MVILHKIFAGSVAAAVAAVAGLVNGAAVVPAPAYGAPAQSLEAAAAAHNAASLFDRADLSNDGALDDEEFVILAIVTAELARLNGFVAIDLEGSARTVALPGLRSPLNAAEKSAIGERAFREFARLAGDDERLARDEFVGAALERFLVSDADRNGVLAGGELSAYAQHQSRLAAVSS